MSEALPRAAANVVENYPEVWEAYGKLGAACANAGPLDAQTIRLVKLALAIGAASEGATHSHVRRSLDEGLTKAAVKQVAMLAIPTLGFPRANAALTWIEDITDPA